MSETGIALLLGVLAGLHTATWGMYKDAPHEGFSWATYLRSPLVGAFFGVLLQRATGYAFAGAGDLVVFFGLAYVLERATVEFYKTFVRDEDQSKYLIPMQLAVFGRPVRSRAVRLLVGAVAAALVVVVGAGIAALEASRALPEWLALAVVGSAGGWISAFGGAWKDAPIEGFELLKFFRSPLIAFGWALLLSRFTGSYIYLVMAATGYTIATIETYKTFFFPHKPRGKFAGMPVHHPAMLERRQRFIPLYAGIWLVILAGCVSALLELR